MQYEYKTKGTCSQRIFFDVEEGKVKNVQFWWKVWMLRTLLPAWKASAAA